MVTSETIKELIFAVLKRRRISKKKFADMVGCHWQTVYRWAQGGGITVELADKALRTLNLEVVLGAKGVVGNERQTEENR